MEILFSSDGEDRRIQRLKEGLAKCCIASNR